MKLRTLRAALALGGLVSAPATLSAVPPQRCCPTRVPGVTAPMARALVCTPLGP